MASLSQSRAEGRGLLPLGPRSSLAPDPPFLPPRPVAAPAASAGIRQVWEAFGATPMECGATGLGPSGERVRNQCFYLALAAASAPPGSDLPAVARGLRQRIEEAVREARPFDWASRDFLGREVGAFADFLVWGIPASPLLAGRAVAIYNEDDGSCEIFRPGHGRALETPVLALFFTRDGGGHYLWVRWDPARPGPLLPALLGAHQTGPAGHPRVPTQITFTAG